MNIVAVFTGWNIIARNPSLRVTEAIKRLINAVSDRNNIFQLLVAWQIILIALCHFLLQKIKNLIFSFIIFLKKLTR